MRAGASLLLFVALAAWVAAWVWVARSSGWVPGLPAWAWVALILASAAPLEVLYRRCRPAGRARHRGRYRDGAEREAGEPVGGDGS